jgi:hypothetical protein
VLVAVGASGVLVGVAVDDTGITVGVGGITGVLVGVPVDKIAGMIMLNVRVLFPGLGSGCAPAQNTTTFTVTF